MEEMGAMIQRQVLESLQQVRPVTADHAGELRVEIARQVQLMVPTTANVVAAAGLEDPQAQIRRAVHEVAQIVLERAALDSLRGESRAEVVSQVQAATQRPTIGNLQPQAGHHDHSDNDDGHSHGSSHGSSCICDSCTDHRCTYHFHDLEDEEFDEDRPTPVESAAPAAPRRWAHWRLTRRRPPSWQLRSRGAD